MIALLLLKLLLCGLLDLMLTGLLVRDLITTVLLQGLLLLHALHTLQGQTEPFTHARVVRTVATVRQHLHTELAERCAGQVTDALVQTGTEFGEVFLVEKIRKGHGHSPCGR
ncbi:hypothetical protein D9M71_772590 [compost metagenome]